MRSVQKGKKIEGRNDFVFYFNFILLQSIAHFKYYGALKKTSVVVKMKVFFWFS